MATATATETYDCMHDRPTLEPNSDISGLGASSPRPSTPFSTANTRAQVLVGFMGTAYLSILVLTGYYFLAFQPDKSPFGINKTTATTPNSRGSISDDAVGASSTAVDIGDTAPLTQTSRLNDSTTERSSDNRSDDDWAPNPIDKALLDSKLIFWLFPVRREIAVESRLRDKIEEAFNNCMLFFADAQLLTGLGILISAYATLGGESGISAYHWNIAVYLAWFSNITHLLVLTFLRKFLSHNTKQRNWRVAGMSCLFILLLVALFPTVYFDWDVSDFENPAAYPQSYARCFFDVAVATERMRESSRTTDRIPTVSGLGMITSVILVFFNYVTRLVKVSRSWSQWVRVNARQKAAKKLKRLVRRAAWRRLDEYPKSGALWDQCILYPLIATVITARIYADFYASMFSEIWWAWSTATWVTLRIIRGRMSAEVSEGDLGFGQVTAIILLASPTIFAGVTLLPLLKLWIQQRPRDPSPQSVTERPYTRLSEPGVPEAPAISGQQQLSIESTGRQRRHSEVLDLMDNCSSCDVIWSRTATALSIFQIMMTTVVFLMMSFVSAPNTDWGLADSSMTIVFQVFNCMLLTTCGVRGVSAGNETSQTRTWILLRLANFGSHVLWMCFGLFLFVLILFLLLASAMPWVDYSWYSESPALAFPIPSLYMLCPWGLYVIYCCTSVLFNNPMD